ncbi:teichoic acid biosynthesis protein C [Actinomadura viridis]|uniref:phage baseplate protein n=1 Tax=Actinomadura viridis TaxID=58110 RepID=UPI0036B7C624
MLIPRKKTALAAALALGLGGALGGFAASGAAAVAPASARAAGLPDSQRFDLTEPSYDLFRHKKLVNTTVQQSFGFDIPNKRLFVAQLKNGSSSDANGDLAISRLDFSGNLKGHMYLKGFGHGVSIGVEPSGTATYLWVEVDPEGSSARGTRLARFKFVDGQTLTNTSSALTKYRPVAGSTGVSATIDPVNKRLAMRYKTSGWRIAVYDLADIKAKRYDPLVDVAQPSQGGETFQGYALYGRYFYTLYGTAYSDDNPVPGNSRLSTIDLNTGQRVAGPTLTKAGGTLTHREPEGLAIYRTDGGQMRLFLGFASGARGERRSNLFYKNVLID